MRASADRVGMAVAAPPPGLAALPTARRTATLLTDGVCALVLVIVTTATWRTPSQGELLAAVVLGVGSCVAARAVVPWVSGTDRNGSAGTVVDLSGLVFAVAALLLPVGLVPLAVLPGFAVDYFWARRRLFAVVLNALVLTAVSQVAALVAQHVAGAGPGGTAPATSAAWAVGAWSGAAVLVAGVLGWCLVGRWLVRGVPLHRGELREGVPLFQESAMTATAVLGATLWRIDPLLLIYMIGPVAILQRLLYFREVQLAARTDDKTGLLNYRFFEECATREVARAARSGQPVSLLVVDMDRLRDVNNTYGHQCGDEALGLVASALAAGARRGDLVCRFGGEEFLVLLPGTPLPDAADVAERLRQAVRATPLRFGADEVTVTISIGVADLGDAGPPAQDPRSRVEHLVAVADARMYAAKGAGRDRVVATAVPV